MLLNYEIFAVTLEDDDQRVTQVTNEVLIFKEGRTNGEIWLV